MKRFLSIFLLLAASVQAAHTYNLTTNSMFDFEDAYYRGKVGGVFEQYIADGDTIVIPAGTAVWGNPNGHSNNGIIYISHAITVKGLGDSTVIQLHANAPSSGNSLFQLLKTGIVFKDMKITAPLPGDGSWVFGAGQHGMRLTNITYEDDRDTKLFFSQGWYHHLIDNCRISSTNGSCEPIFTRGFNSAWQNANTMGTANVDVFVEDCVFGGVCYPDANANSTAVYRFNTINGPQKFDGHGSASNYPPRSFRNIEIYNNTFTNTGYGGNLAIEVRGGTSRIFNNSSASGGLRLNDYSTYATWSQLGHHNISITAGSPVTIVTNEPNDYQTGWPIFIDCALSNNLYGHYIITRVNATTFTVVAPAATSGIGWNVTRYFTAYDYPIYDQVGSGRDGAAREPAYLWNNTQNGGAWGRSVGQIPSGAQTLYQAQTGTSNTFTEQQVILSNRDFFADAGFDTNTGVTVGTRASMDATTPSVTGYGWWVTDEGSWNTKLAANTSGRLYVWNGSAWVLNYTPYTYPHPSQVQLDVANPVFSPAAGTYETTQTVTITAQSPNTATIRFTTNGTTPSNSVGTVYTAPITVSATSTVKAIGYDGILNDSQVSSATYTITDAAAPPTTVPLAGSFSTDQYVTLLGSANSTIRYTTDGSTPNGSSTIYTTPIHVIHTTTIKAIAIKAGLSNSSVTTALFDISLEVGNTEQLQGNGLNFANNERSAYARFVSPVTGTLDSVSVYSANTSATQDIKIGLYHDENGDRSSFPKVTGTPTEFANVGTWAISWKQFATSFPVTSGEVYWIALQVSESGVTSMKYSVTSGVQRVGLGYPAYSDAWSDFGSVGGDQLLVSVKGRVAEAAPPQETVQIPTADPVGAEYFLTQSVTLTTATAGATIYYTTDNTEPTTSSTVYSTPISIVVGLVGTTPNIVKAIATKTGMTQSATMTENYRMTNLGNIATATTLNVTTINKVP